VATPGRKIACWAASVGKTTAIRQFITVHWRTGILYVGRTIEEIERQAYDLKAFIGTTHVLALSAAMDSYQEYVDQPELLQRYPVLLITHERLRLDPPGLLMGAPAYFNQRAPTRQARTYLFIDEHPKTFRKLALTATQQALTTPPGPSKPICRRIVPNSGQQRSMSVTSSPVAPRMIGWHATGPLIIWN